MEDPYSNDDDPQPENKTIQDLRAQVTALEKDLGEERKGRKADVEKRQALEDEKRQSLVADLPGPLKELVKDKPIDELPGLIESLKPVLSTGQPAPESAQEPERQPTQHVPPVETGTPPAMQRMTWDEGWKLVQTNPEAAFKAQEEGRVEMPRSPYDIYPRR